MIIYLLLQAFQGRKLTTRISTQAKLTGSIQKSNVDRHHFCCQKTFKIASLSWIDVNTSFQRVWQAPKVKNKTVLKKTCRLGCRGLSTTLLWSDMLFEIRQQKVKEGQKTSQSSNDCGQNNSRHFSNKVSLNVMNSGYELNSLNHYTCTVIYNLLTPERHEQTKEKKRSKKGQSRWLKVSFKPSF